MHELFESKESLKLLFSETGYLYKNHWSTNASKKAKTKWFASKQSIPSPGIKAKWFKGRTELFMGKKYNMRQHR